MQECRNAGRMSKEFTDEIGLFDGFKPVLIDFLFIES